MTVSYMIYVIYFPGQENNQYFKNVVQNDLHLYNKSFYFRPYYRGELPKSEIRVMNEIEDFVANTGY